MGGEGEEEYSPLFEKKPAKNLVVYRLFAASVLINIIAVLYYRSTHLHLPEDGGDLKRRLKTWGGIGILAAELWFGVYWIITQSLRWNMVRRSTFRERLPRKELPKVDVFVCTADPEIEPPLMVVNTVLSVMAYEYPAEKLSVYLSDDGGSQLTFYAMWEAAAFARHWLPYCRRLKVEPRSPAAYFHCTPRPTLPNHAHSFTHLKKLYEDMAKRIEYATELGRVPDDIHFQHKGFSEWDSNTSKQNHQVILEILVDGRRLNSKDVEDISMPILVYLAREKRPQYFHNFKAGAMNALIRVSSKISNGPIILNVDCDMYSNDSQSIWDALCFFMDEKQSQEIGYVQFPQVFNDITKNDLYGSSLRVISEMDFHGLDGIGGPLYIGSCCFHLRDVLCGRIYNADDSLQWKTITQNGYENEKSQVNNMNLELVHNAKSLICCTYEINTQWGNEVGLKYGCPVEDVITGLSIHCRGWKSAYYNPKRPGFLGVAPTSLNEVLVQHKRWSEGDLQIALSKYCPLWFGHGKISIIHQMGYLNYCFWACNSLATFFYSTIPSLFLISGIPIFPQAASAWFIPFGYIIIASYTYSLLEFLNAKGTILGWWNEQRIWLYKRLTSYLFAFIDSIIKLFGFSEIKFVITSKVVDAEVMIRYMQEKMEFGVPSPMFTILATLALINLFSLLVVVKRFATGEILFEKMGLQVFICGTLVVINLPLYEAVFLRKDKGKIPRSITIRSVVLAIFICTCFSMLL